MAGRSRAWHRHIIPHCVLYAYYTSKSSVFQAYFAFSTIFVNYARFLCQHHYVNPCNHAFPAFIIFNYSPRYRGFKCSQNTKYCFASFLAFYYCWVNLIYPSVYFVQFHNIQIYALITRFPPLLFTFTRIVTPAPPAITSAVTPIPSNPPL